MTGPIICGVDDSGSAKGAARVARLLGTQLGLSLVFVRVVDARATEAEATAIAARLERLSADAGENDGSAAWCVEVGHPADGLVAAAKRVGASMIVVGSSGPRSSLLGSVSADVSRRAACPVVVVPPGADESMSSRRYRQERARAGSARDRTGFVGDDARGEFGGWIARFRAG